MGYEELPGFSQVYLEDSFVESITVTPGVVRFVADVVLLPGHDRYHPPRRGEQNCYESSTISFSSVVSVTWTNQGTQPAIDATGQVDYGGFERFEQGTAEWLVDGDWGSMVIEADVSPSIEPVATRDA